MNLIIGDKVIKHKPSIQQEAVYSAVLNTDSNIVVAATAGSGKSHTLIEASKLIDPKKEILFTAFNKAIVEELSSKIPSHIMCSTLHSIGMKALMNYYKTNLKVSEFKTFPFIEEVIKEKPEFKEGDKKAIMSYKFAMRSAIDLARMTLNDLEIESLFKMCCHYDISLLESELIDIVKIIKKIDIYNRSLTRKYNQIDYVDMLHIPVTNSKIKLPQFDWVLIDEAQDNNALQHALIRKLLKPTARTVYVGDDFQCIYSFMGGDVTSFESLKQRPNTITLPLSTSFRCAKRIVEVAQQICPTIEAFKDNPEGEVRYGFINEIQEGDMVLCRNNRPLFYMYFKLLEQGKNTILLGKDIEVGLQALIAKIRTKSAEQGVIHLQHRLEKLEDELAAKGVNKIKEHPQYIALYDKVKTIEIISYRYDRMSEVSSAIEEMFKEKDNCVKLCTIHHSKGMENDRVFYIERFNGQRLLPSPYAIEPWQKIQERNLRFVLTTRAKKSLIFIQNISDNE